MIEICLSIAIIALIVKNHILEGDILKWKIEAKEAVSERDRAKKIIAEITITKD